MIALHALASTYRRGLFRADAAEGAAAEAKAAEAKAAEAAAAEAKAAEAAAAEGTALVLLAAVGPALEAGGHMELTAGRRWLVVLRRRLEAFNPLMLLRSPQSSQGTSTRSGSAHLVPATQWPP